jgi:hypothetical protein
MVGLIRRLIERWIEWRARKRAPLDITQHPLLQPSNDGPRIRTRPLTEHERKYHAAKSAGTKLPQVDTAKKLRVR